MNFEDVEIKIDKPYPEIINATDDREIVAILKNLATSKTGEIGGVLQYIYQSVVSNRVNEDIASIFEEIGIIEMMHLDLLMNAIVDFGGVPKYEDVMGNPFNASNINYSLKLKDMLQGNIKDEQMAIENYSRAINRVKNASLKNLLERIKLDEERHLQIFKQILNNVTFLSV